MQFAIEVGMVGVAHFGELGLEFGDAAPKPRNLKSQSLLVAVSYIAQQGACHLATLQFTRCPGRCAAAI
jgi:hypothetical protein